MKKTTIGALAGLLLGFSQIAGATIITGQLDTTFDVNGNAIDTTIDFIPFTVNSHGNVIIDSLSFEWDRDDSDNDGITDEEIDVNGDGEIAFFDVQLFVYYDVGDIGIFELYVQNDDDFINTYGDGSIYGYDSYLDVFFISGDYLLSVHACCINVGDDFDGLMGYAATYSSIDYRTYSDHGDYQITFTGDVTVPNTSVPEPSTLAIFALGIMGLASRRFKKQ